MPDTCLFCRIAAGALPAHILHEDDHVIAFLDLHPIRPGHALVIPRAHHVWFEDLPPDLSGRVMACAQDLSRRMKHLYAVQRVGLFFTGIHVPHAHAHVVPMHHPHDVTSLAYLADGPDGFVAPPSPSPEALAAEAARLRATVPG
jgi:histidine triad (HIT) family protein